MPHLTTIRQQIVTLVGAVTLLSSLVKNIGALAIFLPAAFQLERRSGTPVSKLLMPMSFGSLRRRAHDADRNVTQHYRLKGARGDCRTAFWNVRLLPGRSRSRRGGCTVSDVWIPIIAATSKRHRTDRKRIEDSVYS